MEKETYKYFLEKKINYKSQLEWNNNGFVTEVSGNELTYPILNFKEGEGGLYKLDFDGFVYVDHIFRTPIYSLDMLHKALTELMYLNPEIESDDLIACGRYILANSELCLLNFYPIWHEKPNKDGQFNVKYYLPSDYADVVEYNENYMLSTLVAGEEMNEEDYMKVLKYNSPRIIENLKNHMRTNTHESLGDSIKMPNGRVYKLLPKDAVKIAEIDPMKEFMRIVWMTQNQIRNPNSITTEDIKDAMKLISDSGSRITWVIVSETLNTSKSSVERIINQDLKALRIVLNEDLENWTCKEPFQELDYHLDKRPSGRQVHGRIDANVPMNRGKVQDIIKDFESRHDNNE